MCLPELDEVVIDLGDEGKIRRDILSFWGSIYLFIASAKGPRLKHNGHLSGAEVQLGHLNSWLGDGNSHKVIVIQQFFKQVCEGRKCPLLEDGSCRKTGIDMMCISQNGDEDLEQFRKRFRGGLCIKNREDIRELRSKACIKSDRPTSLERNIPIRK